jgi:hypothetical protein
MRILRFLDRLDDIGSWVWFGWVDLGHEAIAGVVEELRTRGVEELKSLCVELYCIVFVKYSSLL